MTLKQLEKGKKYRVTKAGCHLTKLIPKGSQSFMLAKFRLGEGDVIRYEGKKSGWGQDDVLHDTFSRRIFKGWFHPNKWGEADISCLEEVE